MKKSGKRLILATAVFSAALNMNGCVYGAPPEELVDTPYTSQTDQETGQETVKKIETSDNEGETDAGQDD